MNDLQICAVKELHASHERQYFSQGRPPHPALSHHKNGGEEKEGGSALSVGFAGLVGRGGGGLCFRQEAVDY